MSRFGGSTIIKILRSQKGLRNACVTSSRGGSTYPSLVHAAVNVRVYVALDHTVQHTVQPASPPSARVQDNDQNDQIIYLGAYGV